MSKPNTQETIWTSIAKGPSDECWPFLGHRNSKGYGRVSYNGKHWLIHRLIWFFIYGSVPEYGDSDQEIRHSCDNPPCCNPHHLLLGSHRDNMSDCSTRARIVSLKGEVHSQAKLTEQDVLSIRNSIESHSALARKYNVHKSNISLITTRKHWRHI
jgi:hypothetical protein